MVSKIFRMLGQAEVARKLTAEIEREAKALLFEYLSKEGKPVALCDVDEDGCYYNDDCWLSAPNDGSEVNVRGVSVWLDRSYAGDNLIYERIMVKVVDDNGGEYDENIYELVDCPATEILTYMAEQLGLF